MARRTGGDFMGTWSGVVGGYILFVLFMCALAVHDAGRWIRRTIRTALGQAPQG